MSSSSLVLRRDGLDGIVGSVPKKLMTPATAAPRRQKEDETRLAVRKGGAKSAGASTSPTTKKLSTERSRQCRQRQKNYALNLEDSVRALRAELVDMQGLRALRREQAMHTRGSPTGSLVRKVSEYYNLFAHGLAPETPAGSAGATTSSSVSVGVGASRKRSLPSSRVLSPQEQRDFMYSIMDPQLEVYDWVGRMTVGCQPLLNCWESWVLWHSSYLFQVESIRVVDVQGLLAVCTNSTITVTVSEKTLEFFFPAAAADARLRAKLLGQEIVYSLRDTFFFSESGRVVKYTVDMDFIGALMAPVGNYADVLALVVPFNDLAIQSPSAPLVKGSRHTVEYLLS
ncbi:hypothetical protein PybrP1_010044 [[Pythium] brassicae (nom. inval.)]|nr:hypothetical protein PybrP1_010044 [[Pythium] brassicae (nom. inval.)]